MPPIKEYTVGSTPTLIMTFKNGTGVVDLSGYTVTLRFSINGATTSSKGMTVTNAAGGVTQYQFATGDLDEPGMLRAIGYATDGSGVITTEEVVRRVKALL